MVIARIGKHCLLLFWLFIGGGQFGRSPTNRSQKYLSPFLCFGMCKPPI